MRRIKISNFLTVVALLNLDVDDTSQRMQRMHNILTLCITIVTNIFVILIDSQKHQISRHSRVLE